MKKRIRSNNRNKKFKIKKGKKITKMKKERKILKIIFSFFLFVIYLLFFTFKKEAETILSPYIKEQKDFCENMEKYYNQQIEDKLELVDIHINGEDYKMYVPYKGKKDTSYKTNHYFEKNESLNFISALEYYSKKKNIINKKDIFMLDIGGNIGWYPSLLGRYGYTILTFEPYPNNYYVNRKNYCLLNRNSNVIIITKGLNNEEKICDFYMQNTSRANGLTLCNDNKDKIVTGNFIKHSKVVLTKLSNFIPFLSKKNVALIKIDIEGSEGIVIENGINLIKKYKVPFVFIEFTPKLLIEHKTEPKKFIQIFLDNGYKISTEGFLSNNYISYDELIQITGYQINIYLVYKEFLN